MTAPPPRASARTRQPFAHLGVPAGIVLAAVLMTWRVWQPYPLFGHSARFDYFRLLALDHMVQAGVLFPRWLADTYHGHGSPLFHFYAPLSYYIAEPFVRLGLGAADALKLTLVLALAASGLAMYLFCRDHAGPAPAAVAALAYMFAPYHLVDMLVRHALGEHVAFVWLPLGCWGLAGMRGGSGPLRFVVGALSVAGLVLTHNLTALLGMGVFGLWWLALAWTRRERRAALWGLAVLGAGLALSAFFWLPAVADADLTQARASLTEGDFQYADHFVAPGQLLRPSWGYGSSGPGTADDDMSFQVGLAHWLLVLLAAGTWLLARRRRVRLSPVIPYGLALFALALLFTLPLSQPIYQRLPQLAYIQFPWRFLTVAAFASSLLAVAIEPLANLVGRPRWTAWWSAALAAVVIVCYAPYTTPRLALYDRAEDDVIDARPEEWPRLLAQPGRVPLSAVTLAELRAVGERGTGDDDFLPRGVLDRPKAEPAEPATWPGPGQATLHAVALSPTDLAADVMATEAGQLELARFAFPGWRATVDGQPAVIAAEPRRGTVVVPVPAGRHRVELRFGSTPLRRAAGLLGAATLLAMLAYAWHARRRD